jgi:hypothetical protein
MSLEAWREFDPPEIVVPDNLLDESFNLAGKDILGRIEREIALVEKSTSIFFNHP